MKNKQEAIDKFVNSAIDHRIGTDILDYKMANKSYENIVNSIEYLFLNREMKCLKKLLKHEDIGVRLWSALYSLETFEGKAKKVLKKISEMNVVNHSMSAKITLREWEKSTLVINYGNVNAEKDIKK